MDIPAPLVAPADLPSLPFFLPLISDFGFKATFGNEANTDFLCRALQALVKSATPIVEVRLLPNEQKRLTPDSRGGIYDLACTDAAGDFFIVEMQLGPYPEFLQRMKFYGLYRLNTLVRKGDYSFTGLPRIYCLAFLGAPLFAQVAGYHNVLNLRNEDGVILDQQLTFVTVELSKFDKPAAACLTDLDKLIFTMQNAHKITDLSLFPTFWDEHWIRVALEEVDTRSMNPEQLLQFEMQLSANAIAVHRAKRELEEARAKAQAQGREEGREKGREEAKLAAVRRLLQTGKLTPAEIAEAQEVPLAVVLQVQQAAS